VPKRRSLSFSEREEIALECARGTGVRAIARKLSRSASTIPREIRRNSATRGGEFDYRAIAAQWHADRAARRPKISKLALNPALRDDVQDRLSGLITAPDGIAFDGPVVVWKGRRAVHRQSRRWSSAWSPEQISQRLKLDFPEDLTMRISHEAIYQALYIQGRGGLGRELSACLRSGRALRFPRERARNRGKAFIADALMISDRPAEIGDRAIPGHWDGDLIPRLGNSAIGTLVERTTRFTMLQHLPRIEPFEIDGGRCQESLDADIVEPAPDGARKAMPGLGFAMDALNPPTVALKRCSSRSPHRTRLRRARSSEGWLTLNTTTRACREGLTQRARNGQLPQSFARA
jgi:IS30 family transposase